MQVTYTSKLPDTLLRELDVVATKLKTSKKEVIETALTQYFERIKKDEYVASFKRAKDDREMVDLSEEGLSDYLNMIEQ